MKKIFLSLFSVITLLSVNSSAQTHNTISPYTNFLKTHTQSAKEYILNLFNDHDMVIICERLHGEMTQYELLSGLVSDKRFTDQVGNIFMEIGLSTLNPELNTFIHTKNLPADSVDRRIRYFQRNCSMWPAWSNRNYTYFLHALYAANNKLPADKALTVYPSDLPFTWKGADSLALIRLKGMLDSRDSIMAAQIIRQFDSIRTSTGKRKKALVIMNYRHAFNMELTYRGRTLVNAGNILFKKYGGRVANVLLNTVGFGKGDDLVALQNGKWDAAFRAVKREEAGFNFTNSPFGKDSFDLLTIKTDYLYKDIFTGFAFYKPIEQHRIEEGISGLVDETYMPELMHKLDLIVIAGGEFVRMREFKKILEDHPDMLNMEESHNYPGLDALLSKRDSWLK
ncbi:MAG: hypothetical protein U0U70_04475 [Chitinophagaceae bacterium]